MLKHLACICQNWKTRGDYTGFLHMTLSFVLAEMHSESIILRDDFDSYHQQELNPSMW